MAITQLAIYNDALTLLGQRHLSSLVEDRKPRYLLDAVWNLGAVDYCLQLIQPKFASKVVRLNTPSPSAQHGLTAVHALPNDHIKIIGLFSDDKLDQPINRYVQNGTNIACDYQIVYLRYTSNGYAISSWSPAFARAVAAYLARDLANEISPDSYEAVETKFKERVDIAHKMEGEQEPAERPAGATTALTQPWLRIYNDALLVMGLDEIASPTDDSNRRIKLDRVIDAGLIGSIFEDYPWTFALKSNRIYYNPSLNPDWGYSYVFDHPDDMYHLHGIFADEFFTTPIRDYADEDQKWFCELQEVFVQYITNDIVANVEEWPSAFRRYVAACLAKDAAPSLRDEGADVSLARDEYMRRESDAKSNSALASPPQKIATGQWIRSRFRGRTSNRRP